MILVTGGNGFQGMAICKDLVSKGHSVISVSRKTYQTQDYISEAGDVSDKESIRNLFVKYDIQRVVHLVSLLASKSSQNPDLAVKINLMGTLNMLELCREFGVKRFVYASSYNAMGSYPKDAGPISEDHEPLPDDFYGETKRYIEKLGTAYGKIYGIEFVSARLAILVGPGEPSATSAWRTNIFNFLKSGGDIDLIFSPEEILPISHVKDTSEAIAHLVLSEKVRHNIYNIPSESLKTCELADIITNINPAINTRFGTRKLTGSPPIVDSQRIINEFNLSWMSLKERLLEYQKELS